MKGEKKMNVTPEQRPIQKRTTVVNEEKNTKLTDKQKKAILESEKIPEKVKEGLRSKHE